MQVTIRSGRYEDWEGIRTFTQDTFAWGDYVHREFGNWLQDPAANVLVADWEGQPIAVAKVSLLSPREAWLSGARVHPQHRRRGVGSLLNDHGVEWARGHGAQVIRLATEDINQAARSQVEKLGYRPVARFVLARRGFERATPGSNGGQRLPADERLDLASSSEAEPGYLVWSSGDIPRAGHSLFAVEGWSFRRLTPADLLAAAKARKLWVSPSAWAIVEPDDQELWIPLFVTTPEDAPRAVRSLVDLGHERRAATIAGLVPHLEWLHEALLAEHFELIHPNYVYEKPL